MEPTITFELMTKSEFNNKNRSAVNQIDALD